MGINRRVLGALGWALVSLCALGLALDFGSFLKQCYLNYSLSVKWEYPLAPGAREMIVVLTGDRTRIPKAFELLRHRGSEVLLISGAGRGITLTELINQQGDSATSIHTIWEKILLESHSSSTIENALASAAIIREHHPQRVFLITSDYHMLRAARIFKDVLPDQSFVEYPVTSGLIGPWLVTEKVARFIWIVGLEYWKYRLYLARKDLESDFPVPFSRARVTDRFS